MLHPPILDEGVPPKTKKSWMQEELDTRRAIQLEKKESLVRTWLVAAQQRLAFAGLFSDRLAEGAVVDAGMDTLVRVVNVHGRPLHLNRMVGATQLTAH